MIEQALTAGFLSVGVDVLLLGPLPTPGRLLPERSDARRRRVMISARTSLRGPGIKLFGPDCFKLSDAVEDLIRELS